MDKLARGPSAFAFSILLGAMTVACPGCTEPVHGKGCDICTTSGVVKGTVRDPAGAPKQYVAVGLTASVDSCAGSRALLFTSETVAPLTDSLGRYRFFLRSLYAPFTACIAVWGRSVVDTTLAAETTRGAALLSFRADYPSGGPHDSLTIDLVLGPR